MIVFPYVLTAALFAGVLSQFIKFVIKLSKKKKFQWHYLDAYGGMPSSHSAFLVALCTAVGLQEGFVSSAFGITFVISAIIIRDAFGLRMILEEQGKIILKLAKQVPVEIEELNGKNNQIGHRVGHTISEIIVGSLIGIVIAVGGYYLM
ncbi:divergent PAP2 family protein [Patescibacteria group bacterium]|nr:divergent PAP2 family protein [Patescibacteria group bacterium]